MKKVLFFVALCGMAFTSVSAQNLLAKVPSSATMVIKYSGENFSKNVPVQKLNSYSFIKNNLFKMMNVDTLTAIQNMGIDLEQDSYQYIANDDSTLSFVTIMHIKNSTQFLQFIKASYSAKNKTEQKNGFQFLSISDNTYIGWNETVAVIVNTSYQFKESYYTYKYRTDTAAAATTTVDSVVVSDAVKDAVDAANEVADGAKASKPKIYKDGYKAPKKGAAVKKKTATKRSPAKKRTPIKKKKVYDEDMVVEEAVAAPYSYEEDSVENRKRDLWDQQQDMMAKKKQQEEAEKIMASTFTGNVMSIENSMGYKKIIEPAAHVSLWLNSDNLLNQYQNYFSRNMYSIIKYAKPSYTKDTSDGFKTSLNVYFEKDRMRMEQKNFSENEEMQNLGKSVMNSKQNTSLLNVVNPGNIGYFSMSINTEAMLNYYYTAMKKYLGNVSYMSEYSDMVNVYIDLVQIMIDEKGIAELNPGNYLFVMHDMKTKMIEYTDYEYDKEYNSKEVKKKKKELSPNFTFVMDTKREDFMQKLVKLPLKYSEKNKYNYKDKGGYYELAFDSTKYPVSSLFFIVKDGKAMVTTSKEVVSNTLANKGFAIDDETKKSIMDNNYSIKIDSKKLFDILGTEASTKTNKKICAYMAENMGDIKTESGFKDGMIQGTTTIKINGNHANGLEFIFNTIEYMNDLYEKDKIEEVKKED
jgi:Domain of unknown function (DUF4836)